MDEGYYENMVLELLVENEELDENVCTLERVLNHLIIANGGKLKITKEFKDVKVEDYELVLEKVGEDLIFKTVLRE